MDAATLKKVPDNLNRGGDYRPSAGTTGDRVGSLAQGTTGSGPAPTAAPNSGKKLDQGYLLAASHNRSNGQNSLYGGSPDFDEDDAPLSSKGLASPGGSDGGVYPLASPSYKVFKPRAI